jgi:hypothetical protein
MSDHLIHPGTHVSVGDAVAQAVTAGTLAPSVLDTRPWRWKVDGDLLRLSVDRSLRLRSVDPYGRLMTLSCGAALDHARVALGAFGYSTAVERFPDPGDPDQLADVRITGIRAVDPEDERRYRAVQVRHADRRPFAADRPVPAGVLEEMRARAAEHAVLHVMRPDQVAFWTVAADREDLPARTGRAGPAGDAASGARTVVRRVPVREFAPRSGADTAAEHGGEGRAAYLIVATDLDDPPDWLRAGEATSAALLTATALGLVTSLMSEVTGVPGARTLLRSLLPGGGSPQLVIRVGAAPPA